MSKSVEAGIAICAVVGVAVLLVGAYNIAGMNIVAPRPAAVEAGEAGSAGRASTQSGGVNSPPVESSPPGAAAGTVSTSAAIPAGYAGGGGFGLGREALAEEIAAWDIDVRPDGQGLPVGSGSVERGAILWDGNCASCHGDFGEAVDRWPVIAGGEDTLDGEDPVKTVGSYWPYLSTVYDYVRRAMPFGDARSLSDDDVYALTAYILNLNDIVEEDFVLSNENFTGVRLPNESNFFMDDRDSAEIGRFSGEPCMENCKEAVRITKRAAIIDVTPEDLSESGGGDGSGTERTAGADIAVLDEPGTAVVDGGSGGTGASTGAGAEAFDPALVAAGAKAFRRCKSCHQVGDGAENRSGPHLNALMGRAIGGVDGFKYSKPLLALNGEGAVWELENLDAFIANPKKAIRGTKMSFVGLKKEADRAAVIAYILAEGGE